MIFLADNIICDYSFIQNEWVHARTVRTLWSRRVWRGAVSVTSPSIPRSSYGMWTRLAGADCFLTVPLLLRTHTHTFSPLSACGLHTSRFSIPATKPQQQGGNDPATMAVMMESAGGLAGSLTLPNKSPNNSVNIRPDPATGSNALTRDQSPHVTLGHLSAGQESCRCPVRRTLSTRLGTRSGSHNPVATISATQNI